MTDPDVMARESLDRAVTRAHGDALRSGVDVVDIDRIECALDEFGDSFKSRVYTTEERAYCDRRPDPPQHYAARWAAKEAFRKAVSADGPSVPFGAVGVSRAEDWPTLSLAAPAMAALVHAFGETEGIDAAANAETDASTGRIANASTGRIANASTGRIANASADRIADASTHWITTSVSLAHDRSADVAVAHVLAAHVGSSTTATPDADGGGDE